MQIRTATRNAFVLLLVALVAVIGSTHDASSAWTPTPTGTGFRYVTNGKENAATRNYIQSGAGTMPTTGTIRAGDTGTIDIITGYTAADYPIVQWNGSGSTSTFGNTALYNQQNGYDFRVTSVLGGQLYLGAYGTWTDYTSGIVADLGEMSWELSSNFTTTANTATATAITWPVLTSEIWTGECFLTTQCSSTGGVKYSLGGPASSVVEAWVMGSTSAITTLSYQRLVAINTLTATNMHTVGTTPGPDKIHFRIVSAGGGSITLNAASGTAAQTTTIFAGSYCKARRSYAK